MKLLSSRSFALFAAASLGVVPAGCAIHAGTPGAASSKGAPASGQAAATDRVTLRHVERIKYPETARGDVVDTLHGHAVPDPYRWLEDDNAEATKAWVAAQNAVTRPYLDSVPELPRVRDRLKNLWDYERVGLPSKSGGRYFFSRNAGSQNHSVLYVADGLEADPRVLIDPNGFSEDGRVSLAGTSVSEDGRLIAYGLSEGGSDWNTWKVRDVETGQDLADRLDWVKFSGASWLKDGSGFFYSRYDEPAAGAELQQANYFQKLCFHRVGSPQSEDVVIYDRPDQKEWGFGGGVTEDGEYLVISVWHGTRQENDVYFRALGPGWAPPASADTDRSAVVELLPGFTASWGFIGNDGPVFYFLTNDGAPRYRVVAIDVTSPDRANWREVVPEAKETLQGASFVGGRIVAQYLKDARSQVRVYRTDGRHVRDVSLPGIGTAGGFGGRQDDAETFYSYSGFNSPPTQYRYDVATGDSTVFREPAIDFDGSGYVTTQVFYESKDGTKIPMFITHKKGLKRDGTNPTILYGYGGFNIPITPWFSVPNAVWMEMGGVYAVACIRGGGEYGEAWHEGGKLFNKQNCFDDFCAAAEWLADRRYTSPAKLAIHGGSNGGLLVGACVAQRPELFGAAIPEVGVLDMLRFHLFTIGWAWTSDFGSPDEAEAFEYLLKYSPYHNLRGGACYPPTLVVTGDHDDRVVPAHSFKFAAALQAAQGCANPVLIRVETRTGHGAGKPMDVVIDETADKFAFLIRALGMDPAPDWAGAEE